MCKPPVETLLTAAVCLGAFTSCANPTPSTSLSHTAAEGQTRSEMHRSFKTLRSITTALVEGDVPRARNNTRNITRQKFVGAPDDWEEHVEAFVDSAHDVADAGNIEDFASAVGAMAASCAGCHDAIGMSAEFPAAPLSKEDRTTGEHMTRYRWAVDRLWEGMSGPSDEIWKSGAEIFAYAPADQHVVDGSPDDKIVGSLARRIQALGKDALTAGKSARPAAFGSIVSTCTICHTRLKSRRQ